MEGCPTVHSRPLFAFAECGVRLSALAAQHQHQNHSVSPTEQQSHLIYCDQGAKRNQTFQLKGDFAENKSFMTNTLLELLSSESPKYPIWEHPLVCSHWLWALEQYLLYAVSFWDISLVTALNTSQMTAPNIRTHRNITFYPTVIVT